MSHSRHDVPVHAMETAVPKPSLFQKLGVWRKHHLSPAAPWYLACMLPGTALLVAAAFCAQFHVALLPLAKTALAGLCLMATPFAIASATALMVPAENTSSHLGFFNSYQLTERQLIYKLCRIIPVFRVALAEIRSIQPWRDVGPASYASNENNPFWFLYRQIWFWPVPIRQWLKILFSIQALRSEYALTCESGWIIVLFCSRDFAEQINRHVNQLKQSDRKPGDNEKS